MISAWRTQFHNLAKVVMQRNRQKNLPRNWEQNKNGRNTQYLGWNQRDTTRGSRLRIVSHAKKSLSFYPKEKLPPGEDFGLACKIHTGSWKGRWKALSKRFLSNPVCGVIHYHFVTRMHSSRMRTDRCSGRHWMSVPGRGGGGGGGWADSPPSGRPHIGGRPPCGQTDASENITFPCIR